MRLHYLIIRKPLQSVSCESEWRQATAADDISLNAPTLVCSSLKFHAHMGWVCKTMHEKQTAKGISRSHVVHAAAKALYLRYLANQGAGRNVREASKRAPHVRGCSCRRLRRHCSSSRGLCPGRRAASLTLGCFRTSGTHLHAPTTIAA